MPQTVNGIGTTYFLKQNRQYEDGVCQHCNTRGRLESYETWHCVCVFFIPLIPLGKKQILHYCPGCTGHQVISAREFDRIRNEAIAETSAEFADAKDDFNAAIKMHATLVAVQKSDDAEKLARIMLDRYAAEPQVYFYLAAWYERSGKPAIANPLFLKAHELDSQNLGFTRAAAMVHMEEQRPDQARELLKAFAVGTPNFEAALYYLLAAAYQKLGRHTEALDLFRELLAASPAVAYDPAFRKAVKQSEMILGVEKPLVPYAPWYSSKFVKWAAVSILALGGLGYWNYYIATHRTLYVVNGLKLPISVSVDGAAPIQVGTLGNKQVPVSEGEHKVEVTDPAGQFPPSQFKVSASWWERFFRSPVYVSDPSRSAGVVFEQTVFSKNPVGDTDSAFKFEPHIGEAFVSVPHADYHFEAFPAQLKVKGGGRVIKSRVGIVTEPATYMVSVAQEMGKSEPEVFDFVEAHLQADPTNDQLMQRYLSLVADKQPARAMAFLGKHLADRPVRVLFHRRYQDLARLPKEGTKRVDQEAELIKTYDGWVQAEPDNASLQALRGRLEDRASKLLPFLNRALELDPKNPPALLSKAYATLNMGDEKEALELYQQALASNPGDTEYARSLRDARLANGDFDNLAKELRQVLVNEPHDLRTAIELLRILVLKGDAAEAAKEYEAIQSRFAQFRSTPTAGRVLIEQLDIPYLYAKGEVASALEKLGQLKDPPGSAETAFELELETGKLPDVPDSVHPFRKPYWLLCRSLAAGKQGNAEQAAASKGAAIELLKNGDGGQQAIAKQLENPAEAKFEDANELIFSEQDKAIFLVALGKDAPQIREQCLAAAEKLNLEPVFPHHLLKAVIADLRNMK